MSNFLTTCCPEHHKSPARGTLSDRNVRAQVSGNTQHAATESTVASLSSRHSVVLTCRRSFSMLLMLCTHPPSALDNPSRCSSRPFQTSNRRSARHGAHHKCLDFFNLSTVHPTRHDLRNEFNNLHKTRHAAIVELSLHGLIHQKTSGSLTRRQLFNSVGHS